MMKAIVFTKYGAPDVLQLRNVEKPIPKDDEVLIRVRTATATAASLAGRTGKPAFVRLFSGLTKPKKNILGQELAGEIEAIGRAVKRFEVGDKVFGMTGLGLGAQAEFTCMPEDGVLTTIPVNASYEEAVAVIEGGLTALNFLKHKANIQRGQKVLIYGASGSVGTASVQVAKYLGAEVTGVCSSANFELVKSLGVDALIDYTQEDFTKNGQTYDIIFDTVGKCSFRRCKGSLSPTGIYLDAAGLGTILPMIWTSIFGGKKAILATTYVGRPTKEILEDLIFLKELVEEEKIQPVIDRRYLLEETADAYRYVETGRKKGNVVITVEYT